MESTTQPILCCIGSTVAGRPTQFLMEKAFAAKALDWRVLTVEVPAEHFQTAVDGMLAMNFKALRIYPSLAEAACEKFNRSDNLTRFVGRVSAATVTADGWRAWDSYGFGALRAIRSKLELSQAILWLHGDGFQVRSLLVALYSDLEANRPLPSEIIWTGAPKSLPEEFHLLRLRTVDLACVIDWATEFTNGRADNSAAPDGITNRLVLVGDEHVSLTDSQHASLSQATESTWQLCLLLPAPGNRKLAGITHLTITEAEIAISAEAYDFQRWTDQAADCSLLRDAYDEFCAF